MLSRKGWSWVGNAWPDFVHIRVIIIVLGVDDRPPRSIPSMTELCRLPIARKFNPVVSRFPDVHSYILLIRAIHLIVARIPLNCKDITSNGSFPGLNGKILFRAVSMFFVKSLLHLNPLFGWNTTVAGRTHNLPRDTKFFLPFVLAPLDPANHALYSMIESL